MGDVTTTPIIIRAKWEHWEEIARVKHDKDLVMLEHDVDTSPEDTVQLLRAEERLNIPSA